MHSITLVENNGSCVDQDAGKGGGRCWPCVDLVHAFSKVIIYFFLLHFFSFFANCSVGRTLVRNIVEGGQGSDGDDSFSQSGTWPPLDSSGNAP